MHIPVLAKEVADLLVTDPRGTYVDATLGLGGHAQAILSRLAPPGKLIAFEVDLEALKDAQKNLLLAYAPQVVFCHASFLSLESQLRRLHLGRVNGVLFDLGLSSFQVDSKTRGFSFRFEAPLDMRMDQRQALTAALLVNSFSREELVRIFREYGEERKAEVFAKRIVEARKKRRIKTTFDLLEALGLPRINLAARSGPRGTHPATKVFMAFRIAVNHELENLQQALPQAVRVLKQGGRLLVISFHSLEDRIVKEFFKAESRGGRLKILTKKVIKPSWEERKQNPRARSAKLRAAEKLVNGLGLGA